MKEKCLISQTFFEVYLWRQGEPKQSQEGCEKWEAQKLKKNDSKGSEKMR